MIHRTLCLFGTPPILNHVGKSAAPDPLPEVRKKSAKQFVRNDHCRREAKNGGWGILGRDACLARRGRAGGGGSALHHSSQRWEVRSTRPSTRSSQLELPLPSPLQSVPNVMTCARELLLYTRWRAVRCTGVLGLRAACRGGGRLGFERARPAQLLRFSPGPGR
jgi:hypothetical protein